jgi:predicted transcriptional regulator
MLALTYLSYDFPTLSLQDSIQKGLKILHQSKQTNLAVLDGKQFMGNITERLLMQCPHPDGKISQSVTDLAHYSLESEEDVLASLPWFEASGFSLLPVTDEDGKYLGYLASTEVAKLLINNGFNSAQGGIMYIPFHSQRDSFSLIARLIEENNGLITRSFLIQNPKDAMGLPELVIQVQTDQFGAIIQSLERHSIHIEKAFHFGKNETVDTARFDLLLKYLNP